MPGQLISVGSINLDLQLTGISVQTPDHAIEAARLLLRQGVTGAVMVRLSDGGCIIATSEHACSAVACGAMLTVR